jgi:hypothetical protein
VPQSDKASRAPPRWPVQPRDVHFGALHHTPRPHCCGIEPHVEDLATAHTLMLLAHGLGGASQSVRMVYSPIGTCVVLCVL